MSSENSPKPICAQECKLYCLEGVEKIKTEKKKLQNSLKNISFTNAVRKLQQTL